MLAASFEQKTATSSGVQQGGKVQDELVKNVENDEELRDER